MDRIMENYFGKYSEDDLLQGKIVRQGAASVKVLT